MKDSSKTKGQLIKELHELRLQLKAPEERDKQRVHDNFDIDHLNALLGNISDLAYICDDKGNILFINNVFEKMTSHKPEEFILKSFAPLFDEENLKKATDAYQRTLKGKNTVFEVSFKDTGILCAYSNIPFKDKRGKIIGVLGTARDITEQKKAEAELKKYRNHLEKLIEERTLELRRKVEEHKLAEKKLARSETKHRTLFESSTDAVMLLDKKAFFDCNEATLHIFGCKLRNEFLKKHPSELSPPIQPDGTDSMTLADERIATAYKEGKNQFEWMHRKMDGTDFPAEVWLTRMELDGKDVLQATVRDITRRKQVEKSLKESEERFRTIFDSARDDGFFVIDLEGRYKDVNDAGCADVWLHS